MATPCSGCGPDPTRIDPRAIVDALTRDDLDAAMRAGLLDWNGCADCARRAGLAPAQTANLAAVREDRLRALAARERHRARNARLEARAHERAQRRQKASTSALPHAAAAALARARARAANKNI